MREDDTHRMVSEMPEDAFVKTPATATPDVLYSTVLADGARLSVRAHPTGTVCRVSYETPSEHHYSDALEELTVMFADGVPEFSKHSMRVVRGSAIGHDDVLYLHAYLPRIVAALHAPEHTRLRETIEGYVRSTTN